MANPSGETYRIGEHKPLLEESGPFSVVYEDEAKQGRRPGGVRESTRRELRELHEQDSGRFGWMTSAPFLLLLGLTTGLLSARLLQSRLGNHE